MSDERRRLVVANQSKTVESFRDQHWRVDRVESANGIAAGVYRLDAATAVRTDTRQSIQGTIIHSDKTHVYQSVNPKVLVAYDRKAFDQEPPVGRHVTVAIEAGRARVVNDRNQDRQQDRSV